MRMELILWSSLTWGDLIWKFRVTFAVSLVMSFMVICLSVMVTMAGELTSPLCIWTSSALMSVVPSSEA